MRNCLYQQTEAGPHDPFVGEFNGAAGCLRQAAAVFDVMLDGFFFCTADGIIVCVNRTLSESLGYTREEMIGQVPFWLGNSDEEPFNVKLSQELLAGSTWSGKVWLHSQSGDSITAWLTLAAIPDGQCSLASYVGIVSQTCPGDSANDCPGYLRQKDDVTGLYNRHAFVALCNRAIKHARESEQQLAVMLLNLDKFRDVNEALGHSAADVVLSAVAERLQRYFQRSSVVASMGGDEFAVLIEDVASDTALAAEARNVIAALSSPHNIDGHDVYLSLSVGLGVHPRDGDDANALIDHAKTALVDAKQAGRGSWRFYDERLSSDGRERIELEGPLRHAVEEGVGLTLHYQPQWNLATGMVTGVEVLARWTDHVLGPISPERFITLAERCGLIETLGEWVLREACRQMAAWWNEGVPIGKIAVNLSAKQFHSEDLVDRISAALEEFRLPPWLLELELTETAITPNHCSVAETLERLRGLGCSVAIDDFGTGYSTLHYLQHFPADILKIDKSFVAGLPGNGANAALVRTIITLANNFGLNALAEGIETREQRDFLASLGCDQGQGFLLSQPMTADNLVSWIRRYHRDL